MEKIISYGIDQMCVTRQRSWC